jgi:hypothetical protein
VKRTNASRIVEELPKETTKTSERERRTKTDKKILLPEKTYKALEAKAKAEDKTPDQKATEIIEKKAKPKSEEKPSSPFPCDAEINAYGFLGFKKAWFEHLGWHIEKGVHGVNIRIEQNADGSITLRKA